MAEILSEVATWVKVGLVIAGVFGTNVLSNGVQYNRVTAPAEATAASRDVYGQELEGRYLACMDRYEGAVQDHVEYVDSHEARMQVYMMRLDDSNRQLRDCRAGR